MARAHKHSYHITGCHRLYYSAIFFRSVHVLKCQIKFSERLYGFVVTARDIISAMNAIASNFGNKECETSLIHSFIYCSFNLANVAERDL